MAEIVKCPESEVLRDRKHFLSLPLEEREQFVERAKTRQYFRPAQSNLMQFLGQAGYIADASPEEREPLLPDAKPGERIRAAKDLLGRLLKQNGFDTEGSLDNSECQAPPLSIESVRRALRAMGQTVRRSKDPVDGEIVACRYR